MSNSTFYADGFADAITNVGCNPPDVSVYRLEYLNGFADGQEQHMKDIGFTTTCADEPEECGKCGKEIPADSPGDLCDRCHKEVYGV